MRLAKKDGLVAKFCAAVVVLTVWPCILFFFTAFAVELHTNTRRSAFFRQYPGPRRQGRIMAYMLKVPALEFSAPITMFVSMKAYDLTVHFFGSILVECPRIAEEDFQAHALDELSAQ